VRESQARLCPPTKCASNCERAQSPSDRSMRTCTGCLRSSDLLAKLTIQETTNKFELWPDRIRKHPFKLWYRSGCSFYSQSFKLQRKTSRSTTRAQRADLPRALLRNFLRRVLRGELL
jgi:hypothetical protein